jgi:hypothetical protein
MERVRVVGFNEVFLVTRLDHETGMADLLPLIYGKRRLEGVPFQVIEQMPGYAHPDLQHFDSDA